MGVFAWAKRSVENAAQSLGGFQVTDLLPQRNFPAVTRDVMAQVRRYADDMGGALTTTGSLNAYVVTTGSGVIELRAGIKLLIRADRTNTAEATLNVDGLGPLPWVDAGGVRLLGGRIIKGRFYEVVLDADTPAWRVQAGASTLTEIPGLVDLQSDVTTRAAAAVAAAVATAADRSAIGTDRAATDAASAVAQAARTAAEAARDQLQTTIIDVANTNFGIGEIYSTIVPLPVLDPAVGAQPARLPDPDNRTMGAYILKGGTGAGATVEYRYPLNPDLTVDLKGCTLSQWYPFNVNPQFDRVLTVGLNTVLADGSIRSQPLLTNKQVRLAPALIMVEMSFVAQGDETHLSPVSINGTAAAKPQDDYWTLAPPTVRVTAVPVGTGTLADRNNALGLARARAAARAATAAESLRAKGVEDSMRVSLGEVFSTIVSRVTVSGGATVSPMADGRPGGWFISQGQTGGSTSAEFEVPVDPGAPSLAGTKLFVSMLANCNVEYDRAVTAAFNAITPTGVRGVPFSVSRNQVLYPGLRVVEGVTDVLQGDELGLVPYLVNGTTATRQRDDYLTLAAMTMRVASTQNPALTLNDQGLLIGLTRARAVAKAEALEELDWCLSYAKTFKITPDGTGDFISPAQACAYIAAFLRPSKTRRYLLKIAPGTYGDVEWTLPDYVDMLGAGIGKTILFGNQPDNTPLELVTLNSVFRMNRHSRLKGLSIWIRNGRYAVHPDLTNTNPDIVYTIEDCEILHLGNDGARAWQAANGGDPNLVWPSEHAWGMGTASGQAWSFLRCRVWSRNEHGFYVHNNGNFDRPSKIVHRNVYLGSGVRRLNSGAVGASMWFDCLGSRQDDTCEVFDAELGGPIVVAFRPWATVRPEDQVADKMEWHISGSGNNPVPFIMADDGSRALCITSADTSDSSAVVLSGDVLPLLFGTLRFERPGGGLAASAYGTWDVGEHPVGPGLDQLITSMSYRLGDRRGAGRSLTVTANGATRTVVFNADYRSQSNQQILDAINAILAPNAVASLLWVSERHRPVFRDQERRVYNPTSVVMYRKTGGAWTGEDRSVRRMTSADPASAFAGLFLEHIRPGEWGRIKIRGVSAASMDVDRSEAAPFAQGDTFGIGPVPGRFAKGAGVPLLTAVNSADVRWGF